MSDHNSTTAVEVSIANGENTGPVVATQFIDVHLDDNAMVVGVNYFPVVIVTKPQAIHLLAMYSPQYTSEEVVELFGRFKHGSDVLVLTHVHVSGEPQNCAITRVSQAIHCEHSLSTFFSTMPQALLISACKPQTIEQMIAKRSGITVPGATVH